MALRRAPVVDAGAWTDRERLLCVRTDGIGDVLMTAPAIRALKATGPASRTVTLLTSPSGAEAAELVPDVDETLVCRPPWTGVTDTGDPTSDVEVIEELRARSFDAAVIFTVHTQSALPAATWCRLAGIPRRLAYSRENPYALLTDWVPEPEASVPTRHEVVRQLELVGHVGARPAVSMRWTPPIGERERAEDALRAAGVDPFAPWLAIHPGASAPSRRYPLDRFARAADLLIDGGWQVIVIGGPSDAAAVAEMRGAMASDAPTLLGTPLRDLATVLSLARVAVTNNSGPAHVAALAGTPVVVLYALTNLQHAPWGVPHRLLFRDVPCRNCLRSICPEGHHLCLRGVEPEAIARAVRGLVGDAVIASDTPARALAHA